MLETAVGESAGVRRKPWPDTAEAALKLMGEDKDYAVYVGDSEVDIQTARNAGLPCISVSWGFRSRETLLNAGASVIVDGIDELERLLNE